MELSQIIKEMVEQEIDELARISTNIKIGDAEKAEAAIELYAGTWIADMIEYVMEADSQGIPQPELAKKLGKSGQQAINPKVRDFLENGLFTKGELSIAKKEKPESSGIKGRPTSEKTTIAKKINQEFEADINYEPSEEEVETLGSEFINRLKMRVKGTLKRGRPALPSSKVKDGMVAMEPKIEDEIIDDEDIEDEEIEDVMEISPLNESFIRMQKLAGIIK
jgi:hypothetical protein